MQTNIDENVIAVFREKGIERHQRLTEEITRRVINQHSQKTIDRPFKSQMLTEILNQCRHGKLQITPKGLGQTIGQAYEILENRLSTLQGQQGLIYKKRQALQRIQQQQKSIALSRNQNYYQRQQLNDLQKQHGDIQKQLEQLQNNKIIFQQQHQILDRLFKKYVTNSKLKRINQSNKGNYDFNPRNLTLMLYFSIIGLISQTFVVQNRPGWIAICTFFQALFLLLVGYYNKKSVMYLTLIGLISIIMDGIAVFFFQLYGKTSNIYQNENDKIYLVLQIVRKVMMFVSISMRIGILVTAYSFMQPPIQKVYFTICKYSLPLNTRLRNNINRTSFSNIQSISVDY